MQMDGPPESPKGQMIAGLMARGISAEQAEREYQEIERELAYLQRPDVKRQLRRFCEAFAPSVVCSATRRPVMPHDLALDVYESAGGICAYCGAKLNFEINHPRQFTVDHIEPLSLGGSFFDRGNLAACCRQCNSRKHTSGADEFRERGRHV